MFNVLISIFSLAFALYFIYLILSCILNEKTSKYIKIVLSLTILVSVYAALKSFFNTILLILPPLIFLLFKIKINLKKVKLLNKYDIGYFFLFIVISSLFSLYNSVYLFEDNLIIINNDDNFYNANLSMFLDHAGIESVNWNLLNRESVSSSPYHYFESWLIVLLSSFTNQSYYLSTLLICLPVLNSVICLGGFEIIKKSKIDYIFYPFGFLLVFLSGLYFTEMKEFTFLKYSIGFGRSVITGLWTLKMSIIYIYIISSIILYLDNSPRKATIILLILPIVSIATAPIILSSVVLIVLFHFTLKTKVFKTLDIFIPFFIAMYIYIFYSRNISNQGHSMPDLEIILNSALNFFSKTRIIISVEQIFYVFILYFPFIIIGLYCVFRNRSYIINDFLFSRSFNIVFLFFIVLFNAFIFWQLFFNVFGGSEFWVLNAVCTLNIISYLTIIFFIKQIKKRNKKVLIIGCLIGLMFLFIQNIHKIKKHEKTIYLKHYSSKFLKDLEYKKKYFNGHGVKLDKPSQFETVLFNPFIHQVGHYIYSMTNFTSINSLNYINIDSNKTSGYWRKSFFESDPFRQYVKEKKQLNFLHDKFKIDSLKIEFMRDYKMKFIVKHPDVKLDNFLKPFIKEKIVDSLSQETVYFLKKW